MQTQMSIFDAIPESSELVTKKYNSLFIGHAKDSRKAYKITSVGGAEFKLVTLVKGKPSSKTQADIDAVIRVTGIAKTDLLSLADAYQKKKKINRVTELEIIDFPDWYERLVAWGAPEWLCKKVIILTENGGQAARYKTTRESEVECFTYLRSLGHVCDGVVTGDKLYGLEVALPLLTDDELSSLKLVQKGEMYTRRSSREIYNTSLN